jgi:two-component system phosphate regulon response regulator PhoB
MRATEAEKQILIVDRDVAALEPLRQRLSESGFVVRAVAGGAAAARAVADLPPHLVIIDWDSPGFMALELIQVIRTTRAPRVIRLIILSALAQEQDVVAGLNFGADDYIAKPFSLREVAARVAAVLRSRPKDARPAILTCGALVLDASTNRVTAHGQLVNLRGIEYRLLEFLMANIGRTFNRTQLLAQVWGDNTDVDERTVDVNVQRLRKILSVHEHEDYVQTVRGFGYRFGAPVPRGQRG